MYVTNREYMIDSAEGRQDFSASMSQVFGEFQGRVDTYASDFSDDSILEHSFAWLAHPTHNFIDPLVRGAGIYRPAYNYHLDHRSRDPAPRKSNLQEYVKGLAADVAMISEVGTIRGNRDYERLCKFWKTQHAGMQQNPPMTESRKLRSLEKKLRESEFFVELAASGNVFFNMILHRYERDEPISQVVW